MKKYNKFFAISVASSSILVCLNTIGGAQGVLAAVGITAGVVLVDNYLLNRKLSETTVDVTKLFKKPKI